MPSRRGSISILGVVSGHSSFWTTNWTGKGTLEDLVPFVHTHDSNLRICDVVQEGVWNFSHLFTFLDFRLLEDLPPCPLVFHDNLEDLWSWKEGEYTAKSGYCWLQTHSVAQDQNLPSSTNIPWKKFWKLQVPEK